MTPGEQENTRYLGCDEGQKLAILAVAAFHSLHTGDQFRTKNQAAQAIRVSKQMFNVHEVDMTASGVVESIRNGLIPAREVPSQHKTDVAADVASGFDHRTCA